MKKIFGILMFLGFINCVYAKTPFKVKQGNPLVILQKDKKAIYDIDYSKMIVTDGDPENDMDFVSWLASKDEDGKKWSKDWENKEKAECKKTFREKFNKEIKNGFELTKLGKDYKVIFRISKIDFGPAVKMKLTGFGGGEAKASGEFEVRDFNTDEILTIITFENLVGESSFKQIGRIKGLFENFSEELSDFLKSYQKEEKKADKTKQ
ncbi:hypothetical protein [Prevotella jejuni]|uniref:hypothetical protein n=1 Tax=Prevotella jejuni TaxID=1177574 RepID=UPI001BA4EA02|nr:hypothetical protein [Prevotella jejuni]QUB82105.1 hypothetical protein J5A63_14380 [Prevotella jejuni]